MFNVRIKRQTNKINTNPFCPRSLPGVTRHSSCPVVADQLCQLNLRPVHGVPCHRHAAVHRLRVSDTDYCGRSVPPELLWPIKSWLVASLGGVHAQSSLVGFILTHTVCTYAATLDGCHRSVSILPRPSPVIGDYRLPQARSELRRSRGDAERFRFVAGGSGERPWFIGFSRPILSHPLSFTSPYLYI